MTDGIKIELADDERDVLLHLLHTYINPRVWDAVRYARREKLEQAGERAIRLAQLEDLEAEGVLRGDLDAHEIDLMIWARETADTTAEHAAMVVEAEQQKDLSFVERTERIENARSLTAEDYAHRMVCERIAGVIRAARVAA